MGEVYQASDSKLGRSVAIKFLPEAFTHDADRAARFEREARVLASLNHPNIATIYGVEESGGRKFLVMELVPGETLAQKIKRGAIALDESLGIATQITEALEAAHEKGVIHRDLKPANIKVTPEGKVKVLDFGLAKAVESAPSTVSLSDSPTLSMAATKAGIVLGTASYMSPEQAKGRAVDRRTDIFGFGCILYEMLTGRMAFHGDDVPDTLSRILQRDPDWTQLPADVPASIQKLIRICLEKDVRKRRQTAADIRVDIEQADKRGEPVATPRRGKVAWAAAAAALLLAAFLAMPATRHLRETPASEMRVDIVTPATDAALDFALSPDGRSIAFVASGDGAQRLWLRSLDKSEARVLAGTDGAATPFWSPDSHSIGFFGSGKLYRIDVAGGPPQPLTNVGSEKGGTWNAEGTIIYSPTAAGSPLLQIKASSSGEPVAVTNLDPSRQTGHRYPQFLPDGRHFLFFAQGPSEAPGIYLGSLDGGEPKRLVASDSSGSWLPPDMIVYVRQNALLAQRLDLKREELTGETITLTDTVAAVNGQGGFSVSRDGRIAYRVSSNFERKLTWFDRSGKPAGTASEATARLTYPELTRDGRRVAIQFSSQNNVNVDIWLMELGRSGMTRFTFDPSLDTTPVWSPDGTQIAFSSSRKGNGNLYVGTASRAGAGELLFESKSIKYTRDWSADGHFLLYSTDESKTGRDLFALPVNGSTEREPIPIATTPFEESNGQFSPNGRWVAYETNESGRFEIVVQPFPKPTGKWQVSANGGIQPRWRADGTELYFIAADGKLMAAPVSTSGATFGWDAPVALFAAHTAPGAGADKQQYAVSLDGRFLINQPVEGGLTSPITLILNWKPPTK